MAEFANDHFRRYFAEKLWELIPAEYRHQDCMEGNPGVLRSLVEVLADQAAIVRRSNDRLWDDQFIDLCDDWVVPYLGDLVGTRMVSALDRRSRRADVANTIHYRRRAGTLAVLESLIADTTGWEGTVVEEFRRLLRHPHGLDPAPALAGPTTATPAFGLPDLRAPRGATQTYGPWDEYAHLPDMRRHHGGEDGRYGITKLALHLYRLQAFHVLRSTPRLLVADVNGKRRFSFDPSGRATPLFQRHSRPDFGFDWRPAREWELPTRIRCEVLADAQFEVTDDLILSWAQAGVLNAVDTGRMRTIRGIRFASEASLRVRLTAIFGGTLSLNTLHRVLADALVSDCGKAALLAAGGQRGASSDSSSVSVEVPVAGGLTPVARELIIAGNLSQGVPAPADKALIIDVENGLGCFIGAAPPTAFIVTSCYGFSGPIGAGSYRREGLKDVPAANRISGGGAVAAPAAAADALLQIDDCASYNPVANLSVQARLTVQAANEQRPYLDLAGDWTFTATRTDSTLILDGLWIGARAPRTMRLAAAAGCGWSRVRISSCTFDPGGQDADGNALGAITLKVESRIDSLTVESSIAASILVGNGGLIEQLVMRDSIVHSTVAATPALAQSKGTLDLKNCTVIGAMQLHRVEASELLCTGVITVDDLQSGCIRFSAFAPTSQVPRPHRCVTLNDVRSLFTSTRFGDPGYAQLSNIAPQDIVRGGDNGTEIGAFNTLLNAIKLDSLKAKVDEFIPFGLIPLYVTET